MYRLTKLSYQNVILHDLKGNFFHEFGGAVGRWASLVN